MTHIATTADLESSLVDPQTFWTLHTWDAVAQLNETADLYFDVGAIPGWTKQRFRDHFAQTSLAEQLRIHELLNAKYPDDLRVSRKDLRKLHKHFNELLVPEELFGKAIVLAPKAIVRELLGKIKNPNPTQTEQDPGKEERVDWKSWGAKDGSSTKLDGDKDEKDGTSAIPGRNHASKRKHRSKRGARRQSKEKLAKPEGLGALPQPPILSEQVLDAEEVQVPPHKTLEEHNKHATVAQEPRRSQRKRSRQPDTLLDELQAKVKRQKTSSPAVETVAGQEITVTASDMVTRTGFPHKEGSQVSPSDVILSTALANGNLNVQKPLDRSSSLSSSPLSSLLSTPPSTPPPRNSPTKSPFFPKPTSSAKKRAKRNPGGTVSCVPFPPLSSPTFGIAQERLAHDPFQLLVAVQFLNKTRGAVAMPVFRDLAASYPTAEALAAARVEDIVPRIRHLGLQNQRAAKIIAIAKTWLAQPPEKGRRYRTLHYPRIGDGKDIKPGEVLADEDERHGAWEIAHIPGCGDYAIDSWRIFCRDVLRGVATGYNGERAGGLELRKDAVDRALAEAATDDDAGNDEIFEPEWRRVLPKDKELRAYLRWMWLTHGWVWDPITGRRERASEELLREAEKGDLAWREKEGEEGLVVAKGVASAAAARVGDAATVKIITDAKDGAGADRVAVGKIIPSSQDDEMDEIKSEVEMSAATESKPLSAGRQHAPAAGLAPTSTQAHTPPPPTEPLTAKTPSTPRTNKPPTTTSNSTPRRQSMRILARSLKTSTPASASKPVVQPEEINDAALSKGQAKTTGKRKRA